MYESPRDRRLKSDLQALERLIQQSSILDFNALDNPATRYIISFKGKGLMQPANSEKVLIQEFHEVEIRLGINYPRSKPDLKWKTPIFHPNISALGQVCLGGYSTHWVPSLNLDELAEMLWDMVRFSNFDVKSPYNYKSARWVDRQKEYTFPLDDRPLRDLVAAGIVNEHGEPIGPNAPQRGKRDKPTSEIMFIEDTDSGSDTQADKNPAEDVFYIGED